MTFAQCAACPTPANCNWDHRCYNAVVIARTSELQRQIADGLASYDARRAALAVERAADPKFEQPKPVDTKPICWHTYSPFGICIKPGCGYWKQHG